MRVLLSGASGFVGKALGQALTQRGDQVVAVVRDPAKTKLPFPAEMISWNAAAPLANIDAVIHLAGESVAQRWSASTKEKILRSRVDTARQLRKLVSGRPAVYISASAIGYYGDRGDELLNEEAAPGNDFLAGVCREWEATARDWEGAASRVAIFRFGVILGRHGGALEKMLPVFRAGVGGRLASGQQWMSWVHLDDVVGMLLHALDRNSIKGVYNAVAPAPVRNSEFTEVLAHVLHRPALLPVPAFALKLAAGEMSAIFLASQRVSAEKIQASGFSFKYPSLAPALQHSIGS